MTVRRIQESVDEIRTVLAGRESALVIGAGASTSSGAPGSAALVEYLRHQFKAAQIPEGAKLLDAGTSVCNTPPYGRLELVRSVVSLLDPLEPNEAYRQLPRLRWRAIFTTNYDDLVEKAYRSPARVQVLQPIQLPYDRFTIPREHHLPLFYLQGSIKAPHDQDTAPALSWPDFHRTIQQRASALQLLRNVIADGGCGFRKFWRANSGKSGHLRTWGRRGRIVRAEMLGAV